jgi:hypothetical protein
VPALSLSHSQKKKTSRGELLRRRKYRSWNKRGTKRIKISKNFAVVCLLVVLCCERLQAIFSSRRRIKLIFCCCKNFSSWIRRGIWEDMRRWWNEGNLEWCSKCVWVMLWGVLLRPKFHFENSHYVLHE